MNEEGFKPPKLPFGMLLATGHSLDTNERLLALVFLLE